MTPPKPRWPKEASPGKCYEGSLRFMMENRGWVLCHGDVAETQSGERIGHAWCELQAPEGIWCADVTARQVYPKALYYLCCDVRRVVRYTMAEAKKNAEKTDRFGPWDPELSLLAHE